MLHEKKHKQEVYILASQIISFYLLAIVILVAAGVENKPIMNGYHNSIIILFALLPAIILVRLLSVHYKNIIIDYTVNIIFFTVSAVVLVYLSNSSFEILLIMPIIFMSLKYGKKHALGNAAGSVIVLFFVSYKKGFTSIDSDLMYTTVFFLVAWLLGNMRETENEIQMRLERLASNDGLTDLYNHRSFQNIMDEELVKAAESDKPLSLIMLDIDYFKVYNDSFGHQKGDEVLKRVADILQANTPAAGYCARYGGEEFALVLPGMSSEQAKTIGENIRSCIEASVFPGIEVFPKGRLTASVGIAEYPLMAANKEKFIQKADQALYKAKYTTKNKVETYFSVFDELSVELIDEEKNIFNSISTLTMVINAKDKYTYGHSERTMQLSKRFAGILGLEKATVKELVYSALLHDIGKIEIPREILNKTNKLSMQEWDILKQHPLWGAEIIKPLKSLKATADIIRHHHENYDGSGYPHGLRGENIPFGARMLRIIDSYDAMTSERPYKEEMSKIQAIKELMNSAGLHYDPKLLEAFVKMMSAD